MWIKLVEKIRFRNGWIIKREISSKMRIGKLPFIHCYGWILRYLCSLICLVLVLCPLRVSIQFMARNNCRKSIFCWFNNFQRIKREWFDYNIDRLYSYFVKFSTVRPQGEKHKIKLFINLSKPLIFISSQTQHVTNHEVLRGFQFRNHY